MRTVSSRQNPLVRTFRDAAEQVDAEGRHLLLDGLHLIREAREAGLAFDIVAVTNRTLSTDSSASALVRHLERADVDVVEVSEPVMTAISPLRSPSGLVALATRSPVNVDTICANPRALVVVAVDVQDPGNLGAVLRAAEAGGATGALACGTSAHPFSWKALRGSMGSAFRLPTAAVRSADEVLEASGAHGLHRIASVARGGAPPEAIDWRQRSIVFLGGEGAGLPDALVSECHERTTIPMAAPVESLNVAVAAALLVYQARLQRTANQ